MMRPNLAPLAIVPVLLAWPSLRRPSPRRRAVPGAVAVALLQGAVYGSPLRSGYGDLGQLFSLGHVATNMVRYPAWLAIAHTPVLALGILAPFFSARRAAAWALLAFAAGVLAAYLPYVPFTDLVVHALHAPSAARAHRPDDDDAGAGGKPAAMPRRGDRNHRGDGVARQLLGRRASDLSVFR